MIGEVFEPWVDLKIIAPAEYLGPIIQLLYAHEAEIGISGNFGDNRNSLEAKMPLRELMRNFFDNLKSVSSGFGSLSYSIGGYRKADVIRLDVLVANEIVSAFTKIISRRRLEEEAKATVEKLHELLPARQFTVKIQAMALGRIIASKTLSAMRKDVTGYLYGGDITRKRKLWEQQKEGKKRLKEKGRVEIPQEVFVKMMRND